MQPLGACLERNVHFYQRELYYAIAFAKWPSSFCPTTRQRPLHPLECHPRTRWLKCFNFLCQTSWPFHLNFFLGQQCSILVCIHPFPIYYMTARVYPLPLFPALSKLGTSISSDKNLILLIVLDFSAFSKMLTRTVHAIPDKVLSESCIRTNSLSLWKNCFGSISIEI